MILQVFLEGIGHGGHFGSAGGDYDAFYENMRR